MALTPTLNTFFVITQSELNSFLWTIKRDPPSYFYGTIHVPYTRVWDYIPENSKKAFQESNIVYFELDLTDPYTISALTSCQLLPQGENLQDVLPRDIYRRLKRHLEYVKLMMPSWMTPDQRGKGLYADYLFNAIAGNWERKRPVWVMLMVNSLTEADIKTRGVPVLDLYLAQEAERMRKKTGAVEKVEEQCHPLNGLNFSQVIFALNQTLLQQESLRAGSLQVPYTTEDLIKHYNCGDLNSIIFNHDTSQAVCGIVRQSSSYFRRSVLCPCGQLEKKTDQDSVCIAGHFLGNNTVIDVLRSEGYEVEHTPAGQSNPNKEGDVFDEDPLPHLLLPDSLELLEKVERKLKKKRRNKQKKQRHRQFNDLWVRMEESTTVEPAPAVVRIINGYITVQTHPHEHGKHSHDRTFSGSAPFRGVASVSLLILWVRMIMQWLLDL
uniref:Metalloprotease TIKI n=1 Tax=Astyanax mexicanus TaxID=7994 RepID=A0A8B9JMR7_ASTMX